MDNFQYNTQQEPLIQKEYGRNVQKLASHLLTLQDRDKRTRLAHALIELMREIHPNMREGQDYTMKLWDDLYILTGFTLDVDSPYPPPEISALGKKPLLVPYNTHEFKYKQYGHQVVQLIDKAAAMTDPEDQMKAVVYIGRLIKAFHQTWTEKNIEDEVIVQQMREISKGKLQPDLQTIKAENLFEADTIRRFDRDREVRGDRENRDRTMTNNRNMNGKKDFVRGEVRNDRDMRNDRNRDFSKNDFNKNDFNKKKKKKK